MILTKRIIQIFAISLLYCIIINSNIFSFDFNSYSDTSCDKINNIIDDEIQELNNNKRSPGFSIFIVKVKLTIIRKQQESILGQCFSSPAKQRRKSRVVEGTYGFLP